MLRAIAGKEFRSAWRDGRLRLGALAFLALGLVAFGSAAARFGALAAERATAQRVVEEQWEHQGDKNPHAAAHYGLYAFRPVTPLAFFDTGVGAYEGVSIWLEAHKQNLATGRPADDATALARFGELTLGFVLQALLPLAVILLAYPAFASERESGTLRQVLSTGVSPGRLFAGKFLGLGAAVLALLAPLVVLCFAGLAVAPGAAASLPGAFLLLVTYLLYAAIWLGLALVVSARAPSSQAALLSLLTIWAVACFVVPRVAVDAGRLTHPTPTAAAFRAAIDADMAAGLDGVSPAARVAKRREDLLRLYKVTREEDLPINFQGIVFGVQDEVGNAVYDKHFGALHAAQDAQIDVYEAASLLSPRMAVGLVSQEVAGTSVRQTRDFARQAEAFRRAVMDILNRDIVYNAKPGTADYRAGPDLWKKTGEFHYAQRPLSASLADSAPALMVLLLWVAATLGAVVATVRRLRRLAA
jgi:ABC-2 type transport system permease protein